MTGGMGSRIAQVRREAKLSQQEFAKLTGVSQSSLSEIEAGKHKPPVEMLIGAAKSFPEVSLSWLLTGSKGPHRLPEQRHDLFDAAVVLLANEELPLRPEIRGRQDLKSFYSLLSAMAVHKDVSAADRAAADRILAVMFEDSEARRRKDHRDTRFYRRVRRVSTDYKKAEKAVGWEPPEVLKAAVSGAMVVYGLTYEGAVDILRAAKHALDGGAPEIRQ